MQPKQARRGHPIQATATRHDGTLPVRLTISRQAGRQVEAGTSAPHYSGLTAVKPPKASVRTSPICVTISPGIPQDLSPPLDVNTVRSRSHHHMAIEIPRELLHDSLDKTQCSQSKFMVVLDSRRLLNRLQRNSKRGGIHNRNRSRMPCMVHMSRSSTKRSFPRILRIPTVFP